MEKFVVGDRIMIFRDLDHDDPVACKYINKHAIIKAIYPPYLEVEFLNGETHCVLAKNVREV